MSIEHAKAQTHQLDRDEECDSQARKRSGSRAGPTRGLPRIKTIVGVVVLAIAAAAAVAHARGPEGKASASGGTPGPQAEVEPQVEALTRLGISPARAAQTITVQSEVLSAGLIGNVTAALGDEFAGAWFQPAQAKLYIGVTSTASRKTAEQLVAESGIAADVVIQPVRSTWLQLLAAQEQWKAKHAALLNNSQATTGIRPQENAIAIGLSSSIPAAERAALESEAATADVNIMISTAPAQLDLGKNATCSATFVKGSAYCEKTIVSGVGIGVGTEAKVCTAGPMLISGKETYMVTTGHCFGSGNPAAGTAEIKEVKSEYPTGGGLKKIGNEVLWYENKERDMAAIKVFLPPAGAFAEALPTPVPALMAEWGLAKTATPHTVSGQAKAESLTAGMTVCHEGMVGGERCGQIKAFDTELGGTEHLVETTACGERGDSGGPYFTRIKVGEKTTEIIMLGIETGSVGGRRCNEPPFIGTAFEPLLGLKGIEQFSILGTYKGTSLLTTANETR